MTKQTELQRWIALLDEDKLQREHDELVAREVELRERLETTQAELNRVQEEIAKSRGALTLKERWGQPEREPEEDPNVDLVDMPARGRTSIRALMRVRPDVTEWTIPTVLAALVARQWAEPTDEHAVGVALSRMYRTGELARPRKGVYTLPRPSDEGNPTQETLGVRND